MKIQFMEMKLFPEPFSEATQILNESSQNGMYEIVQVISQNQRMLIEILLIKP